MKLIPEQTKIDLITKILFLALLYVLAGKFGQIFSLADGNVSLIWLPSGIALTAILLWGYKVWFGIFLGVFIANISNNLPLLTIIGMGLGSSLGALVGAWSLNKINFKKTLNHTYDIVFLIILGAILNPIVSSLIDIPSLFFGGAIPLEKLSIIWLQFILGDALGVLVMTPSILIWLEYFKLDQLNLKSRSSLEFLVIFILLLLLCFVLFIFSLPDLGINIPVFFVFIFVVWASIRFSYLGASTSILIVCGTCLWGSARNIGFFTTDPNSLQLMINLWSFVISISLVGFVIAVAIFERIEAENQAKQMAITDALTGLYNRRYFNLVFVKEQNRSKREHKLFAFFMLDVDNFKKYNDTYGHQAGDQVLVSIGKVLKQCFQRSSDFTFRLGGEEFAAFTSVNSQDEALLSAEHLRKQVQSLNIEHSQNLPLKVVTISIGVKVVNFTIESSQDNIYQQADQALYQAKINGRNRIEMDLS